MINANANINTNTNTNLQLCKKEREHIIQNRYVLLELLGEGKFGKVYRGKNKKTNQLVAIKMEPISSSVKLLKHETIILNHLYRKGCKCIPIVHRYGIYDDNTFLIMSYYEMTLFEYIKNYNRQTSSPLQYLSICNKIMCKMIELIKSIHIHHVVHRDLKPQNFMLDADKKIYLIDFGLSNIYVVEDLNHIPENRESLHQHVIGNPKYMSIHIHSGYEAVRRDDLISIGYMYLQFLFGELPWDNIPCNEMGSLPDTHILHPRNQLRKVNKSWDQLVQYMKIRFQSGDVENKNIYRYLKYCYFLSFSSEPLYDKLMELFVGTGTR
jgi:serine/threonine protein kinase